MEKFENWFKKFKQDGEHEAGESFKDKLFDLFAFKNSCEHVWDHQQAKIDKLEKTIKDFKTLERQEGYDIESVNNLYKKVEKLEQENKRLEKQVHLKLFSRRQLEHDNPLLKQKVERLEKDRKELVEALDYIEIAIDDVEGYTSGDANIIGLIQKRITKIKSEGRDEEIPNS